MENPKKITRNKNHDLVEAVSSPNFNWNLDCAKFLFVQKIGANSLLVRSLNCAKDES